MQHKSENPEKKPSGFGFSRRAAMACAIASLFLAAFALIWFAGGVLLLVFAAILVAILLDDASTQLTRWFSLKRRFALPLTLLLIGLLIAGLAWILVPRIAQQTDQLMITIPASIRRLGNYLGQYEWGRQLLQNLPSLASAFTDSSMVLGRVSSLFADFSVYSRTFL